ncbi:MAG: hypothetical protein II256_00880 [Bacteroidales bacterium]|jgi:hypothetical protein|nr:hypothetical protein [Bacteroidales bacterium]
MNEEIWMPINGYEGLYEVSSLGRVKALQKKTRYRIEGFNAIRAEKMIKPSMDASGYLHVRLTKDGVTKLSKVHRLVGECFLRT